MLHQPSGAQHDQQGRGGRQFRQARTHRPLEYRGQQITAKNNQHTNADNHSQQGPGTFVSSADIATEQRHHGNQGNGGNVLEQQDGHGQAAMRFAQVLALGQYLQAKGGGRQRQAQPQHDGGWFRLVEQPECQ
ncbi:hypothetical protein D3C76_843570 [compost metagenome]